MARWSALTEYLKAADEDTCELTWDDLATIVGELPPSASRHRTWWSGDRSHVRAWRAAGFRLGAVSMGRVVTFTREGSPRAKSRPAHVAPSPVSPATRLQVDAPQATPDVVLISCSKTKLDHPAAAADLYASLLFRHARAYAEGTGHQWFILSAEHGLVSPDEWLAPYERYLPDTSRAFREAWGHWVVERLDLLVGGLDGRSLEVHAGSAYVKPVFERLHDKGCRVTLPLEGLAVGERLRWYAAAERSTASVASPSPEPSERPDSASDQASGDFAALLCEEDRAVTPSVFLDRGPVGLRVPGLYNWWADERGPADLSDGLGHTVEPGMIYAGLAGATRWPSGKRSTNTLWARIAGMHLGKKHEFSTFRRTLGAIHAHRAGSPAVDEESLTEWMKAHLRVLAEPFEDADTLGHLETQVLRLLDPPLNLQGMPPTPVRQRLKELRRQVKGHPSRRH